MLRPSPDQSRLQHKVWIWEWASHRLPGRILARDHGKAIDQPAAAPVHQLLGNAFQAVLFANAAEKLGGHLDIALMVGAHDVSFAHELARASNDAGGVVDEVRMMNESPALWRELCRDLRQVSFHGLPADVDKRIEAENKIDLAAWNHVEAAAIVHVTAHPRL